MAKQKKKRNKRYTGADAKSSIPTLVRVQAEDRGALKEWWVTYGKIVKILGGVIGVLLALVIVIIGIIGMIV